MKDYENIQALYDALKREGDEYRPIWDDVAKFTGINVDTDHINQPKTPDKKDVLVDDPTSAISVNQFGDYLVGIMWGTGEKVLDLVPSRYVLELVDKAEVADFYDFATAQALYHINHMEAGFHTALRPYAYDQASFGNSGIGVFKNKGFEQRIDDNALIFRNYGIDNTRIDEGKSGLVEYVFVVYHWRVNRIIGEFCTIDGVVVPEEVEKLPSVIQAAYSDNKFNDKFKLVFGAFPREDFDPKLEGKRGTKYRGVWFMDGGGNSEADRAIFAEEDFSEKPISWARQIKVRGEVYGRSTGTLLMSSIRAENFMLGTTIEILEKMADPPLAMIGNALFGDSVLDTSAKGLVTLNSAVIGNAKSPLFPIHDVGDPSGIISFLIPYLNEKITTAFKVDALLDFNSAKDMTATESMQRYVIRGQSLSGMLCQQKNELLEPVTKRCVSLLYDLGELGVDPVLDPARATALKGRHKSERVIPEAVLQVIAEGRSWYEIKFNNELEKLTRTEAVQNLLQVINAIGAIAGMYPGIIEAVDWYKLLKDVNDNLDAGNQILISADEFKEKLVALAEMQQQAMQLEAGQAGAGMMKDAAAAGKMEKEAQNAGK